MRLHIELDDAVLADIDRVAGPRGRSRFIREAISLRLRHERQRRLLAEVRGAARDSDGAWADDPAEWVRAQRRTDQRRVG